MGVSLREYRETLDDALETLEAVLNGYKSKRLRVGSSTALNYTEYLEEVGAGTISIYSITIQVRHSLLHFCPRKVTHLKQNSFRSYYYRGQGYC